MAILGNMILETCAAPANSASINLAGAVAGFSAFRSQIANGEIPSYIIRNATQWETVSGALTHATPDTLARTTVLSNYLGTTDRVNFTGSVYVYPIIPAERAVWRDASNGVTISGIMNAGSVAASGGISGASGTFSGNVSIVGTTTLAGLASGAINATGSIAASGAVSGASGTFGGTVAATGVITAANGTASAQVVNFSQFNPTVSGGTINSLMPGGWRFQAGSTQFTTDGAGAATVSFHTTFGTSGPTVSVSNGDATLTQTPVYIVGTDAAGVLVICPGRLSDTYRVDWIAVGAA